MIGLSRRKSVMLDDLGLFDHLARLVRFSQSWSTLHLAFTVLYFHLPIFPLNWSLFIACLWPCRSLHSFCHNHRCRWILMWRRTLSSSTSTARTSTWWQPSVLSSTLAILGLSRPFSVRFYPRPVVLLPHMSCFFIGRRWVDLIDDVQLRSRELGGPVWDIGRCYIIHIS